MGRNKLNTISRSEMLAAKRSAGICSVHVRQQGRLSLRSLRDAHALGDWALGGGTRKEEITDRREGPRMIAAIYARTSTDQNIPDEEKSVTRQVERARAYADRKGWPVAQDHVYVDDGISGAEFLKRPGFLRLMNALKPRAPFQILIMSEESRMGREQIEMAYALKQIIDAGVRVFFYLENRERTLDSATDKFLLSAVSFAGELEREKAKQRTYDAMRRKAERGHVARDRLRLRQRPRRRSHRAAGEPGRGRGHPAHLPARC
jgi:DNA invertase Pin-like site-specific DNA recombinase